MTVRQGNQKGTFDEAGREAGESVPVYICGDRLHGLGQFFFAYQEIYIAQPARRRIRVVAGYAPTFEENGLDAAGTEGGKGLADFVLADSLAEDGVAVRVRRLAYCCPG